MFLICHVTTILKYHVTSRVGPLILSHHPDKLGVYRTYGSGDDGACNISSYFNSNSNAEV